MANCKSCGAEIMWIEVEGKNHPVNAKPVMGFRREVDEFDNEEFIMTKVRESHFATCPYADRHRRKNGGEPPAKKSGGPPSDPF